MRSTLVFVGTLITLSAHAADYVYNGPTNYSVNGPFSDDIHFVVDNAAHYNLLAKSYRATIACSTRYCRSPGTIYGLVTSAQLQDEAGTAVADLQASTTSTGNFSGTLDLQPGAYVLHVTGIGEGTGKYLNVGQYSVSITRPAVPTCASVRASLQAQGMSQDSIDSTIDSMRAAGTCVGD
jgi:hypothetical protein